MAVRGHTARTVLDGDSMSANLSNLGAELHTRIMNLADSVLSNVETLFKSSPSAKCGPVPLRS